MVKVLSVLQRKIWTSFGKKSRKNTSSTSKTHWRSIDELPLHNWVKCLNGEFNFVKREVNDEFGLLEQELWVEIYDEYLKRYGLNEIHLKHLNLLKKKALLQCDYVITKDRFKLTLIEIEETKLQQILKNAGNGMSIADTLLHIGKWIGERIKIKEITTTEYFDLLDQFSRMNK